MNSPSSFQLQYPLSSRKFWKKIISKIVFNLIFSVILGLLSYIIYSVIFNVYSSNTEDQFLSFIKLSIPLVFIILNIAYGIYVKVYIRRYYYDCGDQFITIKKGVFAPTEIHVQYQKIQDVYVDQDILDRMMGLYDVHIASATVSSGIEAHIDGVSAEVAEGIKNIILSKIHNGNSEPGISSVPSTAPVAAVNLNEKNI